ncbi:uncharacterized protein LOC107048394 [Diachasma alloeum]|uniref:uncharacterized protein LOC107048394 n=1 Tax=Diachasma alloeum TaxID=454923 RepID=UPI0010FB3741|nr:uncharacterized protein LOC107048394 [Diachasma alloeum]
MAAVGIRDPVAQTATLTSLALFLSSGLSVASAAPQYGLSFADIEGHPMEPWEQPCGTPLGAALKRSPQRHSVHRALKRVRTQLRVAQNHFRKDLKDVHDIYSKVYKVLKGQYHMTWLPKNQLEWYHSELWCKEKSKKAEHALPRLHDALQRFAITFHSLRKFRLKSNIDAERTINRRNEIVGGMQNEVLRMLCEVETAILNLGLQLPVVHKAKIVTESPDWATEGDLTLMLIQDWGVLRLYQAFLNDWTRAFRNATATGPGTCDPNTVKPLSAYRPKPKNPKKVVRMKAKRPSQERKKNPNGRFRKQKSVGPSGEGLQTRRRGMRRRLMRNRRRKIVQ